MVPTESSGFRPSFENNKSGVGLTSTLVASGSGGRIELVADGFPMAASDVLNRKICWGPPPRSRGRNEQTG